MKPITNARKHVNERVNESRRQIKDLRQPKNGLEIGANASAGVDGAFAERIVVIPRS